MGDFKKGVFIPENTYKLLDHKKIVYKSSYEQRFMNYLDKTPAVKQWGYELIKIKYFDEVQQKERLYFTDFIAKIENANGELKTYIIEIKPYAQTQFLREGKDIVLPPEPKRKTKKALQNYNYEVGMILNNNAKWKSAILFCKKQGWEFKVLTENELF